MVLFRLSSFSASNLGQSAAMIAGLLVVSIKQIQEVGLSSLDIPRTNVHDCPQGFTLSSTLVSDDEGNSLLHEVPPQVA